MRLALLALFSGGIFFQAHALSETFATEGLNESIGAQEMVNLEEFLAGQKEENIQEFAKCVAKQINLEPVVYIKCASELVSAAGKCSSGDTIGCVLKVPSVVEKCYAPVTQTFNAFVTCAKIKDVPPTQELKIRLPEIKEDQDLSVLVFGDSGKGTPEQFSNANGMKIFCKQNKCNMGLMLGDNFYPNGVTSVNDKKFQTLFEVPYAPLNIPFYVALGNHDYQIGGNAQAQVNYTQKSQIWNMPAKYYQFKIKETEFFVMDTNKILNDKNQQTWLAASLARSTAKWKVVTGHHPIYSGGKHGTDPKMVDTILPMLCQANVDFYLSGHDHHLEVSKSGCKTQLVISGAAASIRDVNPTPQTVFAKDVIGFSHMLIGNDKITLRMVEQDNSELFTTEFVK
jgi:acid phosphatase